MEKNNTNNIIPNHIIGSKNVFVYIFNILLVGCAALLFILQYTYNKSNFALFVYDYYAFIDIGIIIVFAMYYWTKYENNSTKFVNNPLFYGSILTNVLISANSTLANVYDRREISLTLGLADLIIALTLIVIYEFVACKDKTKFPLLLLSGVTVLLLIYRETYVEMAATSILTMIIAIILGIAILCLSIYATYVDDSNIKIWEIIYVASFIAVTYVLFFVVNLPHWITFVVLLVPVLIGVVAALMKESKERIKTIRNLGELLSLAVVIAETIGFVVLIVSNPLSTTIVHESIIGIGATVSVNLALHLVYEKEITIIDW